MNDDLTAFWSAARRLLILRAGPDELPYSPALTWIALGLMAVMYPMWIVLISEPPDGAVLPGMGLAAVWTLVSVAGLLGFCVAVLRVFGHAERFHQFALGLALVHGLAMVVMFGSVLVRTKILGSDPVEGPWRAAVALGTVLLPIASTLWYALAMSHVWAKTLDRGYGFGLLMTFLQNAAIWILPIIVLVAYTSLYNLLT